ncbi:hypothetical protein BDA99DRAFT_533197 [Phascolomyces articulosus]|uniref:PDEase domain-containing protein n=1 Tax=Phascolomyces articulosus TaxID=60185 RepID=A0AAD5PIK1_9FUNG|nr:hypothetical protein BDA99DRAFT_533197 [Phascolomyces articulosus]
MDPSRCSVVVSFHPKPPPFMIEDQHYNNDTIEPSYTSLLQSIFGQVFIHSNPSDALERVKQIQHGSPTVLLMDLDRNTTLSSTTSSMDHEQQDPTTIDEDDDDTVYTPSCSSSCSTASSSSGITDARITWIKKSCHTLSEDVPVIACSSDENTAFMLDCIHAGAADYLLKPLRLDVIKTLFLKLHRCKPDSKMHENDAPPTFLSSSPSLPDNVSTLCPEEGLQHRIKEIFTKDTRFAQSVMDIYSNPPPMMEHTKYRGLSSERATLLEHKVSSWDFNPFELNHDDLIHCAYLIFEQALVLPELAHLNIHQDQLYDFITELSGSYHDGNPYHNFAHAVDVLQCLYYFLCRLGLLSFPNHRTNHATTTPPTPRNRPQDLLRPKDIFALLIAALGHDAAHPGVNNAFLINAGAPLALLYNDRSVLESFHSMTLFQIIKKHGLDQMGGGPGSADYLEFRKIVVNSILATDMSLNTDYVERILEQARRHPDLRALDDSTCEKERLLLCSAIIKCADISNVTRPFLRAIKWAELLVEESVSQGDLERVMGLPVLPMNDRDKIVLEDSQIGFIRFVALELFDSVRQVLPEMSFTVDCMRDNLKRWEHRKQQHHHHDSGVASFITSTSSTHDETSTHNSNHDEQQQQQRSTPTSLIGCKRRSNSLDYHSQAVEVLRKRLSLDTTSSAKRNGGRRRSSAGDFRHKLPTAIAMQTFHEASPPPPNSFQPLSSPTLHHPTSTFVSPASSPSHQHQALEHHHPHHHHPHRHPLASHEDGNPVYCQCNIQ